MPDIKPIRGDQIQIQIYPIPNSPLQYVTAIVSEYQDGKVFFSLGGSVELRGEFDNFDEHYLWDPKQNKWVTKPTVSPPPSRAGEITEDVPASALPSR